MCSQESEGLEVRVTVYGKDKVLELEGIKSNVFPHVG